MYGFSTTLSARSNTFTIHFQYPDIPIFAMLRPTNRITYDVTEGDMETILIDMQLFYENGINGYVFGALKRDASQYDRFIDIERCNAVIRNSHNLPVTFHRAIDMTEYTKKFDNLNIIEQCGFKRVLSSGFDETAYKGIADLIEMHKFARNRYIIIPGCGITADNVDSILRTAQWKEFHASARVRKGCMLDEPFISNYQKECSAKNPFYVTSEETVRELVAIGRRWDFR